MAVSGTSVAITTVGGVLLYSAVKNYGIGQTLHAIMTGQATNPPLITSTIPSIQNGSFTGLGVYTNSAGQSTWYGSGVQFNAVSYALEQRGKPYQWGATGPNSYDCSGLIWAAYKAAGANVPSVRWTTYTMLATLTSLPVSAGWSDLHPGDLIFPDIGHVVMVVDPTSHEIVEAPHTGETVRIMVYDQEYSSIFAIRRVVPWS